MKIDKYKIEKIKPPPTPTSSDGVSIVDAGRMLIDKAEMAKMNRWWNRLMCRIVRHHFVKVLRKKINEQESVVCMRCGKIELAAPEPSPNCRCVMISTNEKEKT